MKKFIILLGLLILCDCFYPQTNNLKVMGSQDYEHLMLDYDMLVASNVRMEKRQVDKQSFSQEKDRRLMLEFVEEPLKSYEYGKKLEFKYNDREFKWLRETGFKSYTLSYTSLSLFFDFDGRYWVNKSSNGVTTQICIFPPYSNLEDENRNVKRIASMEEIIEGTMNDAGGDDLGNDSIFVYKKKVSRATVFGVIGYNGTLIWEDEFSYCITDNYIAYDGYLGDGVGYFVKVRTFGDKEDVNFETLEGRRYYFKPLIEKIISSANIYDIKFVKKKSKK